MPSPPQPRESRLRLPTPERPLCGGLIRAWFDEALGRSFKGRPNAVTCEMIAAETVSLLYTIADENLPLEERRGISPARIRSERLIKVFDEANNLLAALEELKPYWPEGSFDATRDGFALDEVERALHAMPVAGIRRQEPPSDRGKPRAEWLPIGRRFASLVRSELLTLGYPGKVEPADPASITAEIGARLVSFVAQDINPDTFASQMAGDRKTRAKNPTPMFPHADRMKPKPYSPVKAGRKAVPRR